MTDLLVSRPPVRCALILLLAVVAIPSVARAQTPPETIEYYGSDKIGSIRIAFDVNGTVLGRRDFTPFGAPVVPAPAMPKEGFGGNEKDDETDLSYFHARMLQAHAGRFTRPDPVQDGLFQPQAWNRYAYAANNPLTFTDPAGLFIMPFLPPLCPTFVCESTGVTAPLLPIGGGGSGDDGMLIIPVPDPGSGDEGTGDGDTTVNNPTPGLQPPTPTPPTPSPPTTLVCEGTARILKGRRSTIGTPGGFSGDSVGNILIRPESAAVIPSQWASGKGAMRPFRANIWGGFPSGPNTLGWFYGVDEIIGGDPPADAKPGEDVQTALKRLNPDELILELPGGSQDYGTQHVEIGGVPNPPGCPQGTSPKKS